MKKNFLFIIATVVATMTLTSCGSSKETAYRKAYEKAKAQEQAQMPVQTPVQTPVQQPAAAQQAPIVTPLVEAAPTQQVTTQNNVTVRSERVNMVSGTGLKNYSIIVGSFGVRANAEGLMNTLKSQGRNAQVVVNPDTNMYRVVYDTFDSREDAVRCKQSIASTYNGAWLLLKK